MLEHMAGCEQTFELDITAELERIAALELIAEFENFADLRKVAEPKGFKGCSLPADCTRWPSVYVCGCVSIAVLLSRYRYWSTDGRLALPEPQVGLAGTPTDQQTAI